MTETVISARRGPSISVACIAASLNVASLRRARVLAMRARSRAARVRIDRHIGAESGLQYEAVLEIGQLQANRHALHDLHPVAGRVFRRQQRELRTRTGAHAGDRGGKFPARISVQLDGRRLARAHACELNFLEVRLDPHIAGGHQRKQRRGRRNGIAHLQLLDLGHDPVGRGTDHGIGQIELCAIESGLRLLDQRMPLGLDVRVTSQIGECHADLLLDARDLLLRCIERMGRLIELCPRSDARGEEPRLAIILLLRVTLGIFRGAQLRLSLPIGRLQRLDLQPSLGQMRRGIARRRCGTAHRPV